MYNLKLLVFPVMIVILSNLAGHYFPPLSIVLTPIVLLVTSACVCLGMQNVNIIPRSVLTYLFVAMNDILIKLYSGEKQNFDGLLSILSFLFISLIFVSLILIIGVVWNSRNEKIIYRIAALFVFTGLMVLHFQLFY